MKQNIFITIFLAIRSILVWAWVAILTTIFVALIVVFAPGIFLFDKKREGFHRIAMVWARLLIWTTPLWNLKVIGKENLDEGPYVFVSNHQSMGDILVAYFLDQHFKFISKESVFRIPVMGWGMRLCKYISLDRASKESAKKAMNDAERTLKDGISIVLFPEGTRSRTGKINPFKRGAFRLAVENKVPVVPLVIKGTREALQKGSWIFQKKSKAALSVGKPVDVSGYSLENLEELIQVVRDEMIERLEGLE